MTSIVIIPKSKAEKEFLTRLFKKMNVEAHIVEEPTPNEESLKAMADVRQGLGNRVKSSDELFTQLGI